MRQANGSSLLRHQAIVCTKADYLTNVSVIWITLLCIYVNTAENDTRKAAAILFMPQWNT